MDPLRVLLLGGTTEASRLGHLLSPEPDLAPMLSLAGRTRAPRLPPIPHRIGGFGGIPGLIAFLEAERIGALIDATHPFAAQMSRHAAAAAKACDVPLLAIRRPPWRPQAGDRWTEIADMAAAAAALGPVPRRVFLTIGRQDLAPFAAAPQHHYLIRSVDAPPAEALPPRAEVISARGPFDEAAEAALLSAHAIEVLVTKNSGGTATAAKLAAARRLGLPVIMVARPPVAEEVETVETPEAALAWLLALRARAMPPHSAASLTRRGV